MELGKHQTLPIFLTFEYVFGGIAGTLTKTFLAFFVFVFADVRSLDSDPAGSFFVARGGPLAMGLWHADTVETGSFFTSPTARPP